MENAAPSTDRAGSTRFSDYCRRVMARVAAVEASNHRGGAFSSAIAERAVGPLRLFEIGSDAVSIRRSHRCIEADHRNEYLVAFNRSGACSVRHGFGRIDVPAGAFYLLDKALPYETDFHGPSSRILISVPRPLFDQRFADTGHYLECISPAAAGIGRIAADYIAGLFQEGPVIDAARQKQAAAICLDLLAMALDVGVSGSEATATVAARATSGRLRLLSRIRAYIRCNLHDPDLTPAGIAEAHGISKRYLHHVFADTGTSVGAWIREERLAHAYAALTTPRFARSSITEIAMEHGFNDVAHFSRIFKARYRMAPSEARNGTRGRLNSP